MFFRIGVTILINEYGRLKWPPKMSMPSFLDSVTITLYKKTAVADVIKLNVLKLLSQIIQMGTKYHHKSSYKRKVDGGTTLVVQLLRLQASTAGGMCSVAGQGSKIPYTAGHGQKEKKKGRQGGDSTGKKAM